MKITFALTFGILAATFFAHSSLAGPDRYSGKEVATQAPPPCTWSGFYLGIHGGFGGGVLRWTDTDFGEYNPETLTHQAPTGVFGGGQIGYNRQFGSWLVLGLEGEFEGSDINSTQNKAHAEFEDFTSVRIGTESDHYNVQNDWTGTIAMRTGFITANNRMLVYAKGGVAFSHWNYDWTQNETTGVNTFNVDQTNVDPMIGVGLEYAITCHWSAKLEYRHLFTTTHGISGNRNDEGSLEPERYDVENTHESVQLGINFKL